MQTFLPHGKYSETKIFVTGVYGSGKTTYAKEYSKLFGIKFLDFDAFFHYDWEDEDKRFFGTVPEEFITDAIPWNPKTGSVEVFMEYAKTHDVRLVCCVCPDADTWVYRLLVRKGITMTDDRYLHFVYFYKKILPQYFELPISFYDTTKNELISKEEMYSRISWIETYNLEQGVCYG